MADEVRKASSAVEGMSADYPLIDALLGGTRAMRRAAADYLPKWPNEEPISYSSRVCVATLFPAFERTVEVLSSKPFSKPLAIGDDVPSRLKDWSDDIDLQGRSLHVFAADLCTEALSHGLCGVLVEYPRVEGVKTQAEEAAAGVRPYFVHIHPQQLLGWRAQRVAGAWTLTQLRFVETVTEADGEFGEKSVEQVRVLEPGLWRIYRMADGKAWSLYERGETTLKKVPFVPVYGKRKGFMVGIPPLLNLAYLNVKHWQSQSDQDTILHVARVPVLAVIGIDDTEWELTVGASSAVRLPTKDCDIKWVEHEGKAIAAGKESLADLESQMRQAGAELLVVQSGNKSVPQTLADNEQGRCALQRVAEDLEDAIDQAMQLMAEWVGEASGGHVELFKDFGALTLAEASADMLQKAADASQISKETLFSELQRRGIVSPDLQWSDELLRLESQLPTYDDEEVEP